MWIIVATVLLLYVLGLLFICFLKSDPREDDGDVVADAGNPSCADNNSLSASTSRSLRDLYERHHHHFPSPPHHRQVLQRYYQRLFFSRLVSSNFEHDSELGEESTAATDPTRSSLFAYRHQNLRQIHHEINEMSYLLGESRQQSQSEQRAHSVPVPLSRSQYVQPLWRNSYGGSNSSPYSYVHELTSTSPPTVGVTCSTRDQTGVESAIEATASHSPVETCHMVRERQRRLRNIRMELEGLSLQLNNADDGANASGNCMTITPPLVLLHGMTQSATTARNAMLFTISSNISPSSGATFGGDFSHLIYLGREVPTSSGPSNGGVTGNSWSDEDDLPGYESIVCLVEREQRAHSGADQMEESPPPSYSEAVHLYSFAELEKKK